MGIQRFYEAFDSDTTGSLPPNTTVPSATGTWQVGTNGPVGGTVNIVNSMGASAQVTNNLAA